MAVVSVKDFIENRNYYDTVCTEEQTYFVDSSMIMTHREAVNNIRAPVILLDDPESNKFELKFAKSDSEWNMAALI